MALKTIAVVVLGLLALSPSIVAAQSVIQVGSKIGLSDQFDGMALQASKGAWGDLASAYSYQNGGDLIEILIYRPSYPSVSLWFSQGERRTNDLFSMVTITPAGPSEIFTARSQKPNGMRRFYAVGAPFASTAIAVVGFGQWILSIRSSSKTLDLSQQRVRLDKIIESIVPPPSLVESRYPVVAINDCTTLRQMTFSPEGEPPLKNITIEMKTSGGLAAMVASREAFAGDKGIAAQPSAYCRRQSASGKTVWYENVEESGVPRWVLPISETGITVEGMSVPTADAAGQVKMQGIVLTNDHTQSSVREFYNQLPNPISSQLHALTSLATGKTSYASVKYGTADIILGD